MQKGKAILRILTNTKTQKSLIILFITWEQEIVPFLLLTLFLIIGYIRDR